MISCLHPDCHFTASQAMYQPGNEEAAKRAVIDHINHDHADAHVLIACHHELREIDRYMATTISGETGKQVDVGEQIRSECVRCRQFVVEDAPSV